MKNLRNKVILSGIVLLFAFIATIGTTYAWFTVSQTSTVEDITLSVSAANNMLILPYDKDINYVADGSGHSETDGVGNYDLLSSDNYDTSLTQAEIEAAGYEVSTYGMLPATVVTPGYGGFDGSTLASINLSTRELTTLTEATNFNSTSSTTGYAVKLQFWLYVTSSNSTEVIELNDLSITTVDGNTDLQDSVANAVRMSIWSENNTWDGSGAQVSGTPTQSVIFGNDNDYDFDFSGTPNEETNNTIQAVATAASGSATLKTDLEAAVYTSTSIIKATDKDIFTITAGTPTLVSVLIYIEGWDVHAGNNIALSDFVIAFGFKAGTADA
ncbi:MAG: hypothetical protein WC154_03340 [Candidatus Izemoplasmatales bacterium]